MISNKKDNVVKSLVVCDWHFYPFLYSVPHLGVLELNGNNLTSLSPEVFMPLKELEILYLYKNNFKVRRVRRGETGHGLGKR